MFRLLIIALLAFGAWKTYANYEHREQFEQMVAQYISNETPANIQQERRRDARQREDRASNLVPGSLAYRCDGRKYCSQMRSCEEATYFLRHCPDVKMDGNGDGVPCEKQWCH